MRLPQGHIYFPDTTVSFNRGQSFFTHATPVALSGNLNLLNNLNVALPGNAGFIDESQPLRFGARVLTISTAGVLTYENFTQHRYIHEAAYNQIEDDVAIGRVKRFDLNDKPLDERPSNDRYLRKVGSIANGQVQINAVADTSSRMTTELDLASASFQAHFPAFAEVEWSGGAGVVVIKEGQVQPGSSLADVTKLDLPYHQTCPDEPCASGVPQENLAGQPDAQTLDLTPGGGLHTATEITSPNFLAWGARGDGKTPAAPHPDYPYTHRTDVFASGNFFMPGYHLFAADNSLLTSAPFNQLQGDAAPAALLLSGFSGDPANPDLHLPDEGEYTNGDGDYPGLNFIVSGPGRNGASRLAGETSDYDYELLPSASKYYTRSAGVFGRQVGVDGSFDPSLKMYGYDFTLTSFQLSFIASEQHESWVNGAVSVSGHSDFTQQFLGLELNCIGELEGAELDPADSSIKNLVYWNSQFTPLSLRFETTQSNPPGDCPPLYEGFLSMGVKTRAAHIASDLYGTFAFRASDGNLLTRTTGAAFGIHSELGLPAQIPLSGPGADYSLVPVGKLRYSNPDENPDAVVGNPGGFVTFGCTINVPYFRDLQTQVMTTANDSPAAPLYLAPGWTEAGKTLFGHIDFDPNHKGWPEGAIALSEYQAPTPATDPAYLIHAEQDLFGIIPLSYPLRWDDAARKFASMVQSNDDIFVITVDHQIDYLDASAAKVSFGTKYDGLPEINLSSLLNEQIDGAAEAVSTAVTAPLKDAIDDAFQEFENLLSDSLDAVIDPVVDEAAEQVFCPFYDEVLFQYNKARNAGDNWAAFEAELNAQISARLFDAGFPNAVTDLSQQLGRLSDVGGDAASVTADLKDALEFIIIGIDSVANRVELDGSNQPVFHKDPASASGTVRNGLLNEVSGERQIVQRLVQLLLEELVEPNVRSILEPLLNDPASELNDDLNALIAEADPTLDQIAEVLNEIRVYVVEIYDIVSDAEEFIDDFNTLVADASNSVDGFRTIMDKPATRALSFLRDLAQQNGIDVTAGSDRLDEHLDLFEEFQKDVFIGSLKAELKDALVESELMQQFKFLLRQALYDFQAKFEQTVASVLSEVSGIMKDLISETVGVLEDEINPLLGDVNKHMGAAEVSGYAEFNGDSLRKLRLDAAMQFKIPDDMQLNVFLEICVYTSEDDQNGCVDPGDKTVEVTIGATDVPFDWISEGLRASLAVKMSLKDQGSGLYPNGVGGSFEITKGTIAFQSFEITCLAATLAVGLDDCYLGARACGRFNSYDISVGVFFGRTCTRDPLLLVDSDVGALFAADDLPLSGAYVYGEVWLPISELLLGIPATCLFEISAGIGTGIGFFLDDDASPIFVGKMFAAISGEALCAVSIKGEVTMVGLVQDGSFSASGTGRLSGRAGWCPFCVKFSESATIRYNNGDWDVDY